jgi:hypothetical protein
MQLNIASTGIRTPVAATKIPMLTTTSSAQSLIRVNRTNNEKLKSWGESPWVTQRSKSLGAVGLNVSLVTGYVILKLKSLFIIGKHVNDL